MSMKNRVFFVLIIYINLTQSSSSYDKCIVVTTIHYPTNQLIKLSQIPGWRLIVVGDEKTPKDWYLENCDYLSPEKQLSLGYKIASLLPWNHYARKNIGYLYAIQHNASIIYETDDDNEPLTDLSPLTPPQKLPCLISKEHCINVYHHFGLKDVWPRGYPLEKINYSHIYDSQTTNINEIGVEQGIVNGDPDVDAIYRLTHVGEIFFPKKKICALSSINYCPFNSQNTFIHKKAFFTLYLPSTVSMRVADIWRSYYAQKLMQLYNLYLVFSGPNAIQIRNNHNLMNDFILEEDLYLKSMDLINFLIYWKNTDSSNKLKVMSNLISDLTHEGFLEPGEVSLCNAWIEDLISLGYH